MGFPGGSVIKNPPANAGDTDLIPGFGRPPGEGNGNPFQYSCLGSPMDRGACQAMVHGITESWTQRLNNNKIVYLKFANRVDLKCSHHKIKGNCVR